MRRMFLRAVRGAIFQRGGAHTVQRNTLATRTHRRLARLCPVAVACLNLAAAAAVRMQPKRLLGVSL